MNNQRARQGVVLIILDGWGISAPWGGNAIAMAKTPNMSSFINSAPNTTLEASGEAVGLPAGEPGNSEVGHLTIGAGKIIKQDLPLINDAIKSSKFFRNSTILEAINRLREKGTTLHLIGLVSNGGAHSHIEHLFALLKLAKDQGLTRVSIHMITDGRDTSPYSAIIFLNQLEHKINELGVGQIATVSGRYFAMDRDQRWNRTQAAYETMVFGKGRAAASAQAAIAGAYKQSFTDEFIPPTTIQNQNGPSVIGDGDGIIMFNFRPDRVRQLTKAFVLPNFNFFQRKKLNLSFVTMTEYEEGLPVEVAFKPELVHHPLAEIISSNNLAQLHIAETEKYDHVTNFFNGTRRQPYPGESRVLIPSPKVATYDTLPEMSAQEITETTLTNIKKNHYSLMVINFANADMVAHTGNLNATIRACEVVDKFLGRIVSAATSLYDVVITADHGNAEELLNPKTGDIDTSHNINPVPFIVLSSRTQWQNKLRDGGGLSDVAPTVLSMLDLPKSTEMTGVSLFDEHGDVKDGN